MSIILSLLFYLIESFSHQHQLMIFLWSLKESKSFQVSYTLLIILANLNSVAIWTVFTRALIYNSFSHFTNPLVTVPRTLITIGITVIFLFNIFFTSLAKVQVFIFCFCIPLVITLWSAETAKNTIRKILWFCWSLGLVFSPRFGNLFIIINIYSFRVFHISVTLWFFTGVWVTASLLRSPGLLLRFWPFSVMLSFG